MLPVSLVSGEKRDTIEHFHQINQISIVGGRCQHLTETRENETLVLEILTAAMLSPGSADSLLTGARLLQKAASTSAELHAFASTCKNPPDCHDAFTNTDPSQFVSESVFPQWQ